MVDFLALEPGDLDITQGGGIAYLAVSLLLIFWMWQNIRNS